MVRLTGEPLLVESIHAEDDSHSAFSAFSASPAITKICTYFFSTMPPSTTPKKLDWEFISTWVFRIFMTGMAIGGAYAASVFVKKSEMVLALEKYENTPNRIERLEELSKSRELSFRAIDDWRRVKDETDTRLTLLLENQQRQMERQQIMIDRQQQQIDALPRR